MHYILQLIGRFDYKPVTYDFEGKSYRAVLSTKVMQEHFRDDCKVILFAPESLVTKFATSEEAIELLTDQHNLRRRIMEEVNSAGFVNEPFDLLLMQSVGSYDSCGQNRYTIMFENTVPNIVSSAFSQLLLLLNKTKEKNLMVDISTGQNLYITSLLEAIRGVLVYEKLNSLMQGDGSISVNITYTPPILSEASSENQVKQIKSYPYDVKAFFEIPIKEKNVNLNNLVQLSYKDQSRYSEGAKRIHDKIRDLKMHLTTGRLVYNAIKYNTPLVLFHDQISNRLESFKEIINFPERLKELITELEKEHREVHKSNGIIRVSRKYNINKDLYINIHFHLALLNSIYSFWEDKIKGREAELTYIRKTFSEAYDRLQLGLNSKFLERDCNEISMVLNNSKRDLTQARLWEEVREEVKYEQMNQKTKPTCVKPSDQKRNFFAHSGFLSNITKVWKRGSCIYLSYDNDQFISWVDNPEG